MNGSDPGILHRDVQTKKPWFVWPVILVVSLTGWWPLVQQAGFGVPIGSTPASLTGLWFLALLVGLAPPLFVISLRLIVEVRPGEIVVRFRPIWTKRFSIDEIETAEPADCRPIADYGGWGIRYTPWKGWAYTLSGDRGVQLTLQNGKRVFLGSDDPEPLADAIRAQLRPKE